MKENMPLLSFVQERTHTCDTAAKLGSYTTIVMKDMPLKQEMPAFLARPEIVKLRNRLTVRCTKPRKMRHDRVAGCNSGSHLATEPVSQTGR